MYVYVYIYTYKYIYIYIYIYAASLLVSQLVNSAAKGQQCCARKFVFFAMRSRVFRGKCRMSKIEQTSQVQRSWIWQLIGHRCCGTVRLLWQRRVARGYLAQPYRLSIWLGSQLPIKRSLEALVAAPFWFWIYIYIYITMYVYIYTCICMYMYIHMEVNAKVLVL